MKTNLVDNRQPLCMISKNKKANQKQKNNLSDIEISNNNVSFNAAIKKPKKSIFGFFEFLLKKAGHEEKLDKLNKIDQDIHNTVGEITHMLVDMNKKDEGLIKNLSDFNNKSAKDTLQMYRDGLMR